MARVSDNILPVGVYLRLVLDRYQEIMRLPEAAFNGLNKDEDDSCYDCAAIWKQTDRDGLALALSNAEEIREQELGYHLAPVYIANEVHEYSAPIILNRKHLISIGVQTILDIEDDVALVLRTGGVINDPVVITIATTVTDTSEIIVCYPGEDVEIRPSRITIVGGVATINIPRSRLVDPSIDTNCDPAPLYTDDANFLITVDIKRRYMDTTQGANYVWTALQTCGSELPGETTQTAYARIENARVATIRIYPALVTDSIYYSNNSLYCYLPERVLISYLSGRQFSIRTEIETARLAHTMLPGIMPDRVDLCSGCWKRDMMPDPSEEMTPYGSSVGAIIAWVSDSRAKVGQGGIFPKLRTK
jgi:hypothetical protein